MTYARSSLVPPGAPGLYHCVSRCVRRAFLCGDDQHSGQSFEHRRQWVEDRLHLLAETFSISIWAIAPGILGNRSMRCLTSGIHAVAPHATLAHPCAAYAVMSNHLHVIVQVSPDVMIKDIHDLVSAPTR